MELVNTTNLVAGYTMATDKTGRESLVVVAKGTIGIPDRPDSELALLDEQVPLVTGDIFTGEPGFSAPLYETDFAPGKPRCDVLLNGSACAPGGQPTERVRVGLRVGSMTKAFEVVGNRVWGHAGGIISAGRPEPFTKMPISYDNAFGGVDKAYEDPALQRTYLPNHAGKGFFANLDPWVFGGKPLPNTEELDRPVTQPSGNYTPMSFGPLARGWQHRIRWAGTYDARWLEHQFPFLPEDFDTRYFQSAPDDQQIDHPRGGEEVVLYNLTPQGRTSFRLPGDLSLPVVFTGRDGSATDVPAVLDTVLLEPDVSRFMLCWRASLPLRRNIREVRQVTVGHTAQDAEREQRLQGKGRFGSLHELVHGSRRERETSGVGSSPR
jgi:hypothetical protein